MEPTMERSSEQSSGATAPGFPDTPIELILARQVASYLTLPMILTDAEGDLVFYNEPAENLLGLTFDNTGPLPLSERVQALELRDEEGIPVPSRTYPWSALSSGA